MNTPQQKLFKVLLIGDSCEDEYVYGKCERISPEAPVPVMVFSKMESKPGMAGNVCLNLQSFELEVTFLTNSETITKTRFIDEKSNQQILRVDTETSVKPLMLPVSTHGFDALVISDYDKGYLTHSKLSEIINSSGIPIFVDSKKNILPSKENCFIKINDLEYKHLLEKENHSNVIITKGSEGCVYKNKYYPAEKVNVYDVVGAGDTFLSALVYGYLKTDGDIDRSITLANKAAAIAVQNNGTYILTDKDVKNICDRY
jgi:D-beta-D-heptose 7-phosphate kinase/D-beta-D-heptose 1-phosphate adenosyltransferase